MNHDEHATAPSKDEPASGPDRTKLYAWIAVGLAVTWLAFYLVTEHWPHVLVALPYAGIVLMLVMHLFMHKGHSHGGGSASGHAQGTKPSGDVR
ncbi:DUF2933 domain-containing protein [Cryobacterium sp. PH31-AA6]|uniref:DUF2933 domain-containing protein n=1 Tax=Cryobacterium sp. PH31-AA6 TaxID=3046205 RepID=UPI0024BBDEA7|nr:DUF2933 domain-containing protein [Cryobacterium sp. PH31-AA6]MDJ0323949.1 DUF2933 domain-containing protein [Cryobacterium sp. PH31-AA6]